MSQYWINGTIFLKKKFEDKTIDILKWQDFIRQMYSKNSKIEFLINYIKSNKIYNKIKKFKNRYFNMMFNNQNLSKLIKR